MVAPPSRTYLAALLGPSHQVVLSLLLALVDLEDQSVQPGLEDQPVPAPLKIFRKGISWRSEGLRDAQTG